MMARSTTRSNHRPDTLMQDRSPLSRRSLLQRTAGPYIRVSICLADHRPGAAARSLTTDTTADDWRGSFGPIAVFRRLISTRIRSRNICFSQARTISRDGSYPYANNLRTAPICSPNASNQSQIEAQLVLWEL